MEQGKRKMFKMVRIAVGFFLITGLAAHASFGQPLPGSPAEEAGKPKLAEAIGDNISIDFKDADIRNVLRLLAEKSGTNIVVGQEVEGKVTVKLVDVPWKKALDVILRSQGLVYECEENIVRVTTMENLEKEDLSTRVFDLNYANSEKVSKAIENMLSPRGKINFDERMNLLIITDVSANLSKIAEVVGRLDARTLQVLVEARIVEVTLSKGEDLGIDWSILKGFGVGVSGIGEKYERTKTSSRSSERKTTDETADNRTTKKTYDREGAHDEIIIAEDNIVVQPIPEQEYETESDTHIRTLWDKTTSFTTAATHSDISSYVQTAVLSISDFNLVLSALKARGDFNLVSNPKIVTTDNQEATMFVGTTVPIPIYKFNEDTGSLAVTGYADEDVGITLLVTPTINKDRYITLEVYPTVNEVIGYTGPHNERPITSKREAKTQVVIKDGNTLAIGGLISDKKKEGIKKVPLLGNIPFLGWLFKHRTTEIEKIDLIIFLTPTILGGE